MGLLHIYMNGPIGAPECKCRSASLCSREPDYRSCWPVEGARYILKVSPCIQIPEDDQRIVAYRSNLTSLSELQE